MSEKQEAASDPILWLRGLTGSSRALVVAELVRELPKWLEAERAAAVAEPDRGNGSNGHATDNTAAPPPPRKVIANRPRSAVAAAAPSDEASIGSASIASPAPAPSPPLGPELLVVVPDAAAAQDLKEDLEFLLGARSATVFPEPGVEPYVPHHPRVQARAARIETLVALARPEWRRALPACERLQVVVATATALTTPVPPRERLLRAVRRLAIGDTVDLDELIRGLVRAGYGVTPQVGEYGDVSRRGGIVDVYTFGRENPVRIEFDGDEIASIREFDSFSQRSLAALSEVIVLPLWEWIADTESGQAILAHPPEGLGTEQVLGLVESLETDGTLEGIEWFLPRLRLSRSRLTDFFDRGAPVVVDSPTFVRARRREWSASLDQAYEIAKRATSDTSLGSSSGLFRISLPPSPPAELFFLGETWDEILPRGPRLFLGSGGSSVIAEQTVDPKSDTGSALWGHEEPQKREQAEIQSKSPESVRAPESMAHARTEPGEREATEHDDMLGISSSPVARIEFGTQPPAKFDRNLEQTQDYLIELHDRIPDLHILCDTENHRDRLADLLKRAPVECHVGNLAAGFLAPREGFAVMTDHEIFSRIRRKSTPRRFSRGLSLEDLLALVPGNYVVHVEHGIGLYKGLSRLVMSGQETDCLTIEYSGGDLHYVPVDQLSVVQKYSAEEGARPTLSRLGGKQWAQTKAKIKKSIKDMAGELIKIYAIRKSRPGYAFRSDTSEQMALEASFPYDETVDQMRSIEDVKRDMEIDSPMDRLICGDVGYGKTEVAMRAAFKAVMDSKQVAVLVPTTLLSRQHFTTFSERLADSPVRVDWLSRFRTPLEAKQVQKDVAEGKIDILIGTHAILGKAVAWKDLGLVIIDEEQLFGVAAKEKLKSYRETVDVLTLTATPIPRTMHLALLGGRDMSTILTPPRDRRSIQTEIVEFRDDLIAHALMKEADRGGQSFFVHNRVESIDAMANYLSRLVPHLRIAVGHGQMRERALEDVMRRFLEGEYDVLVSTMIIESGLDLPNVNTILINRGDTFGLSQLYQLRGRVGRSSRKAYCYILVPPYQALTEAAQKRLKAMEEFEDLGSGYQLALRDLEIRGAGNLLGAEQHGFIVNVGFELYCQLLDEAVSELRGAEPDARIEPRMTTDIEAFLPDDYVSDSREKINLYKTLADARTLDKVEEISAEMTDRFGRHPEPVRNLLGLRRVRILAAEVGVEKVTVQQRLVALDMARELRKAEIQKVVSSCPFPVEFALHGRHRLQTKPGAGGALSTALILLRALDPARKKAAGS